MAETANTLLGALLAQHEYQQRLQAQTGAAAGDFMLEHQMKTQELQRQESERQKQDSEEAGFNAQMAGLPANVNSYSTPEAASQGAHGQVGALAKLRQTSLANQANKELANIAASGRERVAQIKNQNNSYSERRLELEAQKMSLDDLQHMMKLTQEHLIHTQKMHADTVAHVGYDPDGDAAEADAQRLEGEFRVLQNVWARKSHTNMGGGGGGGGGTPTPAPATGESYSYDKK